MIPLYLYICASMVLCGAAMAQLVRRGLLAPISLLLKAVFYLVLPAIALAFVGGRSVAMSMGQILACLGFFAGAVLGAWTTPASAGGELERLGQKGDPMPENRVDLRMLVTVTILVFAMNVFVTLRYDLVFRRIGTELLASVYAELPAYARLSLRLWEILLGAALTYLLLSGVELPKPMKFSVAAMWIVYFLFTFLSSRLLVVDLLLLAMITRRVQPRTAVLGAWPAAGIFAVGTYMARVGFDVDKARDDFWSQWVERLDCFSLLREIDTSMWTNSPPLLGRPWIEGIGSRALAFVSPRYQGQFIGAAETGSKNAISRAFALFKDADYPTCMLSDMYANFWVIGAILLGFGLVRLASACESGFVRSRRVATQTAYLSVLGVLLIFERDVSDAAFNAAFVGGALLLLRYVSDGVRAMSRRTP